MKWKAFLELPSISIRQQFLVTCIGVLLLMISIVIYTNGYSANAQTVSNNQVGFSKLNISLSQAINIAEESLGNNSYSIAAFGEKNNQSTVYSIILATDGIDFYDITIDAHNGHLLSTEKFSKEQLESMHLKHSQRVLTQPHLTNNTFVH